MRKSWRAGRWGLMTLGSCLAAAGLFFSVLLGKSYARAKAQRDWVERQALVVASGIETRATAGAAEGRRYRFRVRFRYACDGEVLLSERVKLREEGWSRERSKAERLAERYAVGSRPSCFVDPSNPQRAVLERESLAPGYTLWFPALFVVGGAGMVGAAIRTKREERLEVGP